MISLANSLEDLGRHLRSRELSASELARAALEAIEEAEPRINAFITITAGRALAEAAAADADLRAGIDRGPLMGIPVAVKDVFRTKGIPTTCGSAVLRDFVSVDDAEVVRRLQQAGAVLVGKTNMQELAFGLSSPAFGRTNNPVDTRRTTSGSSGGSAAAVASGTLLATIGTDAGGSIRVPAAFCGVVGLKPSYGRVSRAGAFSPAWSLDHCGPFARSVRDARAVFEVISTRRCRSGSQLGSQPRLGLVVGSFEALEPQVELGLEAALASARAAGASIEARIVEGIDQWFAPWNITLLREVAAAFGHLLEESGGFLGAETRLTLELGVDVSSEEYVRAQRYRHELLVSVDRALAGVDVLVTPTVTFVAPEDDPAYDDEAFFGQARWTAPLNLTGHPAISVPAPVEGLPVGVQLIGRRDRDEELLDVAEWLEDRWREEARSPQAAVRQD